MFEKLKYKKYISPEEGVILIREKGAQEWLDQLEVVRQHNLSVIDLRFKIFNWSIAIFITINLLISLYGAYHGRLR